MRELIDVLDGVVEMMAAVSEVHHRLDLLFCIFPGASGVPCVI